MRFLDAADALMPADPLIDAKAESAVIVDLAGLASGETDQVDGGQRSSKVLRTVIANMAQGICFYDSSERLLMCNARYAEILGLPLSVLQKGASFSQILQTAFSQAGSSNPNVGGKVRHIRKERTVEPSKGGIKEVVLRGHVIAISQRDLPDGGWISTLDDITERRATEERLTHLARHDMLTGLANRTAFLERLNAVLGCGPSSLPFGLFCFDLDGFKPVNDKLGHLTGDAVLRVVAERMRGMLGEQDLAARLGGDEFGMVVECASEQQAKDLAKRVIEEIRRPILVKGVQVKIDVSVGIAMGPGRDSSPDQLMGNADLALYEAKKAGRGCYRLYGPELDLISRQRCDLERDLRVAVKNQQLTLHYQPVVDIHKGVVTSCEALLRWTCPVRGSVSPASFIPMAEEIGLIEELGDWVLRDACREAFNWPDQIKVAVNVSPVQLHAGDLDVKVAAILAETGLAPERLELEVTETAMIKDVAAATDMLIRLKRLGVAIALDDFGTGYSSLSFLRTLPFDRIKIDRSFVQDLGSKPDAAAIVRAMLGLCGALGVLTTAEGTESEQQLEILRALGCSEVQGFRVARPCPPADLRNWISAYQGGQFAGTHPPDPVQMVPAGKRAGHSGQPGDRQLKQSDKASYPAKEATQSSNSDLNIMSRVGFGRSVA